MTKSLSLVFLFLALIHCGASAPRQSDAGNMAGKPKASESGAASVSPQGFAADQILKFFGQKTGKELMAEKKNKKQKKSKDQKGGVAASQDGEGASGALQLPPKPMALNVPSFTRAPALAGARPFQLPAVAKTTNSSMIPKIQKIEKLAVPPPPVSRLAVPQIRQEIQRILELNKQIKNVQNGRTGQFQRVQEQARLHEKILNDLESSKQEAKGRKVPQKEDLLAQEKLRIIHEETQQGKELLEGSEKKSLEGAGANKDSGKTVTEKAAAARRKSKEPVLKSSGSAVSSERSKQEGR